MPRYDGMGLKRASCASYSLVISHGHEKLPMKVDDLPIDSIYQKVCGSFLLILHTKAAAMGPRMLPKDWYKSQCCRSCSYTWDDSIQPTSSMDRLELQERSTRWFVSQQKGCKLPLILQPVFHFPRLMVLRTVVRHSCMRKRVSCKVFGKIDRFWLLSGSFLFPSLIQEYFVSRWSSIFGCFIRLFTYCGDISTLLVFIGYIQPPKNDMICSPPGLLPTCRRCWCASMSASFSCTKKTCEGLQLMCCLDAVVMSWFWVAKTCQLNGV